LVFGILFLIIIELFSEKESSFEKLKKKEFLEQLEYLGDQVLVMLKFNVLFGFEESRVQIL